MPAFLAQNHAMPAAAREAAGMASEAVVVPSADHFRLLQDWISLARVLGGHVLCALARPVRPH